MTISCYNAGYANDFIFLGTHNKTFYRNGKMRERKTLCSCNTSYCNFQVLNSLPSHYFLSSYDQGSSKSKVN